MNKRFPYGAIVKKQNIIFEELQQLKAKMRILGSLGRFEELAKKGRVFAKDQRITPADVLKND